MNSNNQRSSVEASSHSSAVTHLLESIAIEEEALANLIRTEANKTSSFIGGERNFTSEPSMQDILTYNQGVIQFMDTMIMTQWLMLKKLNAITHIQSLQTKNQDETENRYSDKISGLENWEYDNIDY
ncbi:hypothetical protein BC351_02910 [Paenibacillus ferrarius]|uniref:Uncharacterized protein n=1 Tax=Paenibacillus ferrarius TaxID=1469647 RepID=A0A1V4HLC2_9BACL|nr:hypothetical protein [Paenibacillus ferrarius]OPH57494.1 hypothetical protein BC351_02910 [Paenibacillus ferrarius]